MVSFILAILCVVLFCGTCHLFIRSVLNPAEKSNQSQFSKLAIRVERTYKAFAWGVMCLSCLVAMVVSLGQIYFDL